METPKHAVYLDPGWYPDSTDPTSLRYWDGEAWGQRVPKPAEPSGGISTWKIIRGVAIGIIVAGVMIAIFNAFTQPTEVDCAFERLEYMRGERAYVSDACMR